MTVVHIFDDLPHLGHRCRTSCTFIGLGKRDTRTLHPLLQHIGLIPNCKWQVRGKFIRHSMEFGPKEEAGLLQVSRYHETDSQQSDMQIISQVTILLNNNAFQHGTHT